MRKGDTYKRWRIDRINSTGNLFILQSETGKYDVYLCEPPPNNLAGFDKTIILSSTALKNKANADKRFDAVLALLR